jgi:glycosyltransferase involved in cell wall biosynthesis
MKLWLNVTSSRDWKRPPVGVIRVEQRIRTELSIRLGASDFGLCHWLGTHFEELHLDELTKSIESPARASSSAEPGEPEIQSYTKREAIKAILRGLYSLSPKFVRKILQFSLRKVRSKIVGLKEGRLSRGARSEQRGTVATSVLAGAAHFFKPGDVLLSLGLDWDHLDVHALFSIKKLCGIRLVTCCYDLIPILFPQYCVGDVSAFFATYFIEMAHSSDLILCISKQSESDLRKFLHSTGAPIPKTTVFYLGDEIPSQGQAIDPAVEQVVSVPYILYVSSIERRKNHLTLYQAYHLLCSQYPIDSIPTLILVGMPGWGTAELLKDVELDPLVQGKIVILNSVRDADLNLLYSNALFCVYPSFYEGWGLPVAEALNFGKLVICSDQGSLPEVGADLVIYVSPWSALDWARTLWRYFDHRELIVEHETKVLARFEPRKWSESARQILDEV